MDNRINGSPEGGEQLETGLCFELGDNSGEQLVFDEVDLSPKAAPVVEIDLSGAPAYPDSEEFQVPDSFEVDKRYDTQSFIVDPMSYSPTYIPRFTGAGENLGMNFTARKAPAPTSTPNVDPTSEIDEGKEAPHVVISGGNRAPEVQDESIRVLKFEDVDPSEAQDPEEKEVAALKSVIMEAARPESEEEIPEKPIAQESTQQSEVEALSADLPDPFLELTLVDYVPSDNDPETPSAEEAPKESSAKGSLGEFTHPAQRDAIKDRFLDHLMSVKIRLIGALVLALALVAVNVLSLFSVDVLALLGLGGVSYASAVLDLQFSVCLALFALPEILRSCKALIKKVVSAELVIPFSLLMIILHDVAVIASRDEDYPVFGVLIAIQVIVAILASYYRINADFISFKLISKNTVKSFLDKRLTRSLPRENLALDGAVDEYNSKIARMFRAAFVSDFFRRTSVAVENTFNNVLMLLSSIGVSVITALITWLVSGDSFADFTATAAFVFLLSFPSFSMLIHKLSHHSSALETDREHSAFVGEKSLYACSDIDVIAYEDTEVFGTEDVSVKKVHLYGKTYNAGKAMQSMYAIFSVVGGPLADMFAASVEGEGLSIIDAVIEDDGISGVLGEHKVAAGTLEYMQRLGISIPEDDAKTNPPIGDSTKIMYGAEDGEVYVKFFIRYSFSEEFTMLLPSLKAAGIVPLIYTRDPNLTVEFFKMLTFGDDIIRVMKKHTLPSTEDKVYRRVSAGIVTLGGKLDAVNMVLHAKKYTAHQSAMAVGELIAMLAGAALAVIFAFTGSVSVPMLAIGALQLAWCAYLYVRTYHTFKHKNAKDKDNAV